MGYHNRAIEHGEHSRSKLAESRRTLKLRIGDPVNVDVWARFAVGRPYKGEFSVHEIPIHHPLDTHLKHVIAAGIQPRHLEVDEGEWRLLPRQVPRRSGRRRQAGPLRPLITIHWLGIGGVRPRVSP